MATVKKKVVAPTFPTNGLAKVPEAAKFLGVSRPTVYRMVHEGALSHILVRDSIRIPWESLHALANAAKRGTAKSVS